MLMINFLNFSCRHVKHTMVSGVFRLDETEFHLELLVM